MNSSLCFLDPIVNTNQFHILHPTLTYMRNHRSVNLITITLESMLRNHKQIANLNPELPVYVKTNCLQLALMKLLLQMSTFCIILGQVSNQEFRGSSKPTEDIISYGLTIKDCMGNNP